MARKNVQPGHENHERWLISYADFITLLFAFFVVMFASSQGNRSKAAQVSESVRRALEEGQLTSVVAGILGGGAGRKAQGNPKVNQAAPESKHPESKKAETEIADLLPSLQFLITELQEEIDQQQVQIRLERRGLVISLQETAFFPSAADTFIPGSLRSLEKIAQAVHKLPNPIRFEGHTDALPIHNFRFRNNWDLSAARSIAMLELFTGQFRVPADRLSIAGYADRAPVAPNSTEEGRARNRRVDIVILNEVGAKAEPGR